MEPYLDNPPCDEQGSADARARAEASYRDMREQAERRRALMEPESRRLLAAGPPVRDVDAALRCGCGCHPRAADPTHHDGGASCPCQRTDAERAAAAAAVRDAWAQLADLVSAGEEVGAAAAEAGRRLGVRIDSYGGAAPFVVTGQVDGFCFYLRERHDMWRLVIAGEDDPGADVWRDRPPGALVIAEGVSAELPNVYQEVEATVEQVVCRIRGFLRRRTCTHRLGSRFCPDCGAALHGF